jgi:hypothetical protein
MIRTSLLNMHRAKKEPLKRLDNDYGRIVYGDPFTSRNQVSGFYFRHEMFGREAVAKFIHEIGTEHLEFFSSKDAFVEGKNAYADYRLFNLYFEFDSGSMTEDQLREKIMSNYSGQGRLVALFWMASRPHESEDTRLKKLLKIAKEALPGKPNRILGAKYSEFLAEPYFYNHKGKRYTCNQIGVEMLRTK